MEASEQDATTFVTRTETRKPPVYRLEDAVFPGLEGKSAPLPDNANFPKAVDSIVNTLMSKRKKLSKEVAASLRAHYESAECTNIINDMFWFTLMHMEQPKAFADNQEALLNRVSKNYIELFMRASSQEKELLFHDFHDAIAQGVFCCMFFAFPKSRSKLTTEETKKAVYELVGRHIGGMDLSSQNFNYWNLDLGNGNVLEPPKVKLQETDQAMLLPKLAIKKPVVRKLTPLQYSPLVRRYLEAKNYDAVNCVPVWSLQYTYRNLEREREVDKRFSYFRFVSREAERSIKERELKLERLKQERSQLNRSLKSPKRIKRSRKSRLNQTTIS